MFSSKPQAELLSSYLGKWSSIVSTNLFFKQRNIHTKVEPPGSDSVNTRVAEQTQEQTTALSPTESREVLLSNPALVVCRELEWGNVFFGFEQANKYSLKTPDGRIAGYIAEEDGLGKSLLRNILRTHRSFKATILDPTGQPVMVIRRPAYLLTSCLYVETPEGDAIGEIRMNWHPWRRKYDLYVNKRQFGKIDAGFLAVEFPIQDEHGNVIGSVSKDFTGFAKELFTDATQYVVRLRPSNELVLDSNGLIQSNTSNVTNPAESSLTETRLSTEERAVLFAVAVSVDFDYFSLHSRHGSFMPFPFMMPFPWPGSGGGEKDVNKEDTTANDSNSSSGPTPMADNEGDTKGSGEDSKWAHFEEGKFEEPDDMFEDESSNNGWSFGSFFGDDDDDDD